jgi:hypothetical protein
LEKEGKVKKSAILWSTIWIIVQSILALFVTPNFLQCMYSMWLMRDTIDWSTLSSGLN